jgi:hypothetical protein
VALRRPSEWASSTAATRVYDVADGDSAELCHLPGATPRQGYGRVAVSVIMDQRGAAAPEVVDLHLYVGPGWPGSAAPDITRTTRTTRTTVPVGSPVTTLAA